MFCELEHCIYYWFTHLSVCLYVCLSVCTSVCLSVCLSGEVTGAGSLPSHRKYRHGLVLSSLLYLTSEVCSCFCWTGVWAHMCTTCPTSLSSWLQTKCSCGATSEPLPFIQFVHYVSATVIVWVRTTSLIVVMSSLLHLFPEKNVTSYVLHSSLVFLVLISICLTGVCT